MNLSDTPPPAPDTGTPPPPPPPANTPWYNGVTDAEFIGTVQNRGLDKKDALTAAQDFYKAHREATQMISRIAGTPDKDRIIITPKPDATQTEKDAYYQSLGRPAKAEEYDFAGLKFPDGDHLDNEFVSTLKNAAFKANVSKEGAAAIAKDLITGWERAWKPINSMKRTKNRLLIRRYANSGVAISRHSSSWRITPTQNWPKPLA